MDTFTLSRNFWNFAFENPEKINPWHSAIYFFALEHCNRLGWKEKFWFPSQMVMEAIWIKNWRTYQKYLQDLVEWWFIKMIEKSKNQYSSNIIAIVKNTKALDKALDKALQKHSTKHSQSTVSIDIQYNNITNKQETNISKDIQKQSFWNEEINNFQDILKKEVFLLWLLYKSWNRERDRIKNILTAKEFWNICDLVNMSRLEFSLNILRLSTKLPFWNWKIYNAETIYKHYEKIYNEWKKLKENKQNLIIKI